MKTTYLTRDDSDTGHYDSIKWCFDVHIKAPDTREYNFALLYGNEDAPQKIEFWRLEPNFDTPPDYAWSADPIEDTYRDAEDPREI